MFFLWRDLLPLDGMFFEATRSIVFHSHHGVPQPLLSPPFRSLSLHVNCIALPPLSRASFPTPSRPTHSPVHNSCSSVVQWQWRIQVYWSCGGGEGVTGINPEGEERAREVRVYSWV